MLNTINHWTRAIALASLASLAGVSGAAGQDSTEPISSSIAAAADAEARKEAAVEQAPSSARAPQPPVPRDPAVPRPRLSGSATGYVDNAFIGSQVRVRFDRGGGIQMPDRSEFFYAKCGCYRLAGIDPDAPGPVPPFTGTDPTNVPLIENDLAYSDFQVYGEYALGRRFSILADAPIRSLSPSIIPEATGIGDMRLGVKVGLVATDTNALTFQLRSVLPTGDSEKGLGTDHTSIEMAVLYNAVVADRLTFGAEFGTWNPIGGSSAVPVSTSDDWSAVVVRYGAGIGYDLVGRPNFGFAPVVELFGWHFTGGYASFTPDGTPGKNRIISAEGDVVNLKVGGRFTFNGRHSVYAGYGFPLTDKHLYDDIFRIEYRLAF